MRPAIRLAASALAALALVSPVTAQNVAVAGVGGQYGYFDLATRAYTQISAGAFTGSEFGKGMPVDPDGGATGLAYDATTNTLYVNAFDGGAGTSNTQLRTVNQATGATTLVAAYNYGGAAGDTIGLAVNSSGQMYNYNWGNSQTFSINKSTAAGTALTPGTGPTADRTSPQFYTGKLAFLGSTLYGTMNTGTTDGLYTFNLSTGAASFVGNGSAAATYTDMIAFSNAGTLYGINGTTLYQISTANGGLTNLGVIGGSNVPTQFVAAVVAPVPEPSAVLFVATAAAGIGGVLRRRKAAAPNSAHK